MDFAKALCNVFVKKDGQECFAISPFAPRIAFMEVVRFLVNVCVTQAGLVQIVTNAWRVRTVFMADVLTRRYNANVMMDIKALVVKNQYAVKAAIQNM